MKALQKSIKRKNKIISLPKTALQAVFISLLSTSIFSVASEEIQAPNYEARSTKMVSMSVYKKMTAAQEALLSDNHQQAIDYLHQILTKNKKLKGFDKAKIFELLASITLAMEQYDNAVSYSEKAIALQALSKESEVQLFHRLVYMHFFLENYDRAIAYFELWVSLDANPPVKTYFAAAQIYAATQNMPQALQYALQGMDALKAAKNRSVNNEAVEEPVLRENWIKLLIAIRLNLKEYEDVSRNLETAISLWPQRAEYYRQLSAVYQELKREQEALVVLSLAYQNKLIDKDVDIHRLGQQYRYHNNPHKAAVIIERELHASHLKPTEKTWETMANAWLHARHWQQANGALQQAAERSEKGKLWLQLCQTSTQDELWIKAKDYCQKSLKKGQLDEEEGTAKYLIALSEYYQNELQLAVTSFKACTLWEKTKDTCQTWQTYTAKAIVDRKAEAEHMRLNAEERIRRQQNQQSIVDKALMQKI